MPKFIVVKQSGSVDKKTMDLLVPDEIVFEGRPFAHVCEDVRQLVPIGYIVVGLKITPPPNHHRQAELTRFRQTLSTYQKELFDDFLERGVLVAFDARCLRGEKK